jgi:hypothetical protein
MGVATVTGGGGTDGAGFAPVVYTRRPSVGEGKTRVVHRLTHEELVLLLGGIEPARTQRKMHPTSFRDKQR